LFLKLIYSMQHYSTVQVRIGNKTCKALVADSFFKRAIGLMFRQGIGYDTCMLFISNRDGMQGLTMQNMLFPIDVLWLDKDLRIVDLMSGLKPDKGFSLRTYNPKGKARYVVEFKSGFLKKNSITPRSKIKIKRNRKQI
jgi:uncharacterized protein